MATRDTATLDSARRARQWAIGRRVSAGLLALALAACGGDDSGEATSQALTPPPGSSTGNPPASGNRPPTVSGTPSTKVLQGVEYRFVPTASDPDGNALTFSIVNRPPWAHFDVATGELRGTPGPGDIGTYPGIRISVSDGAATTALASFGVEVVATAAGSAVLSWIPPTERDDGSALTSLSGFRVYWGTARDDYDFSVDVGPGITAYVVENLTPATWYFTMTAIDSQGVESRFSNVVSKTVR